MTKNWHAGEYALELTEDKNVTLYDNPLRLVRKHFIRGHNRYHISVLEFITTDVFKFWVEYDGVKSKPVYLKSTPNLGHSHFTVRKISERQAQTELRKDKNDAFKSGAFDVSYCGVLRPKNLDEAGEQFDIKLLKSGTYSGIHKTEYYVENRKKIYRKIEFQTDKNGKIHGEYRNFLTNGSGQYIINYSHGTVLDISWVNAGGVVAEKILYDGDRTYKFLRDDADVMFLSQENNRDFHIKYHDKAPHMPEVFNSYYKHIEYNNVFPPEDNIKSSDYCLNRGWCIMQGETNQDRKYDMFHDWSIHWVQHYAEEKIMASLVAQLPKPIEPRMFPMKLNQDETADNMISYSIARGTGFNISFAGSIRNLEKLTRIFPSTRKYIDKIHLTLGQAAHGKLKTYIESHNSTGLDEVLFALVKPLLSINDPEKFIYEQQRRLAKLNEISKYFPDNYTFDPRVITALGLLYCRFDTRKMLCDDVICETGTTVKKMIADNGYCKLKLRSERLDNKKVCHGRPFCYLELCGILLITTSNKRSSRCYDQTIKQHIYQ